MIIRQASLREIDLVLDWAAAEGWNPGLADAAAFQASDPEGFLVAEVAGEAVAAISLVAHSDLLAFLGLYLCRPEWRGKGIGFALWQHALAHAGSRAIGLDGVAAQQANYAKSGFVRTGATTRYEGALRALPHGEARLAGAQDLAGLLALDARACGYKRERFVRAWTTPVEGRVTIMTANGFATARRCRSGAKIGPVVCAHAHEALRLARGALAALGEEVGHVAIDLPEASAEFAHFLVAEGLAAGFRTARMWRGAAPEASAWQHAIATMELG